MDERVDGARLSVRDFGSGTGGGKKVVDVSCRAFVPLSISILVLRFDCMQHGITARLAGG